MLGLNWRKYVLRFLLKTINVPPLRYIRNIQGLEIIRNVKRFQELEYKSTEELVEYQDELRKDILLHAYKHVPYYKDVFDKAGVINSDGEALIENWGRIQPLTKKIIEENFNDLKSTDPDVKKRKPFMNHSGGSTGKPVDFMQDMVSEASNFANKIYYKTFANQLMGEKEIRIWGSEADFFGAKESWTKRLKYFLYNRIELNAFTMTEDKMQQYLDIINKEKPSWIEAYVQPIYELALFAKNNDISVYSPKGILTSAGTLYPEMRETIESVFHCRVYNRYGSREVGDIACNCDKEDYLHLSIFRNYIEILDDELKPVKPGEFGNVYVTTLDNLTMPLIRYRIGDIAVPATESNLCSCGRGFPRMENVEGRELSTFRTKSGKVIPGQFFVHFVGVVYNKGAVERFQVIQEDYDTIRIKVIVKDRGEYESSKSTIEKDIIKAMEGVEVVWEEVDNIEKLPSGKYLYTVSKLEKERRV